MDRIRGHLTVNPQEAVKALTWVKMVAIGSTCVGKTCLIKHFCESTFTPGYQPTVGVDYGFKIENVRGKDLRVHLWDLSGSTEYLDVRNELYGGTDAIFLVYDVTNSSSFADLDTWIRELIKYGSPNVDICVVANKCDMKGKRVVSANEGQRWAERNNYSYHETSCSTGKGVDSMFVDLLECVLSRKQQEQKGIHVPT